MLQITYDFDVILPKSVFVCLSSSYQLNILIKQRPTESSRVTPPEGVI